LERKGGGAAAPTTLVYFKASSPWNRSNWVVTRTAKIQVLSENMLQPCLSPLRHAKKSPSSGAHQLKFQDPAARTRSHLDVSPPPTSQPPVGLVIAAGHQARQLPRKASRTSAHSNRARLVPKDLEKPRALQVQPLRCLCAWWPEYTSEGRGGDRSKTPHGTKIATPLASATFEFKLS